MNHRVTGIYSIASMPILAVVTYMSFTQPLPSERPVEAQQILYAHVPTAIPGPPPLATGVDEGEALAYMRIPRFGHDWLWTVVEGVALDDLASGPGHYPDTPLMGEVGNSSYAAHRAGHGDPFIDFDQLRIGDEIVIAQNGAEWTYTLIREPKIIPAYADWVAKPKLHQGFELLTLTTCWPKYGSEKRMFVRGVLTSVEET